MANVQTAANLMLASNFTHIRDILLDEQFQSRWDKPLAYWTLPNDRRLPIALLGRPLGEILKTPFEQLAATPGIGEKKIKTLLILLQRAQNEVTAAQEESEDPDMSVSPNLSCLDENGIFDPTVVSEAMWADWRETVKRHDMLDYALGRLTPTLQEMPTVIWHTPLSNYMDVSLAEMRALKTHGEKRVRVVLEVFYLVHRLLGKSQPSDHLEVRLVPQFVQPVENWIRQSVSGDVILTLDDVRQNVIIPLLDQVKIDAGIAVYLLAQERLGVNGTPMSVRAQSRRLGVTRARVYQLLDECAKIMEVRWPEGKMMFRELERKLEKQRMSEDNLIIFDSMRDLYYPKPQTNYVAPAFA